MAGACVALGRLTRTGKTFTLLFVVYWYLGVSGGPGAPAWLDFAGVIGR